MTKILWFLILGALVAQICAMPGDKDKPKKEAEKEAVDKAKEDAKKAEDKLKENEKKGGDLVKKLKEAAQKGEKTGEDAVKAGEKECGDVADEMTKPKKNKHHPKEDDDDDENKRKHKNKKHHTTTPPPMDYDNECDETPPPRHPPRPHHPDRHRGSGGDPLSSLLSIPFKYVKEGFETAERFATFGVFGGL